MSHASMTTTPTPSADRLDADGILGALKPATARRIERLHVFASLDSTNRFLLDMPPPARGALDIAIADHQHAGRGRRGRRWTVPPGGGLCLSAAMRIATSRRELAALPLAAGVAARRAVRNACGERGRRVTATELMRAHARIQAAVRRALAAMDAFDAILSPTLAAPPVPIGYFSEAGPAENLRRQHRFTPFATAYNLSGQPAVTVPLHWNDAGLPIGVMIAGRLGGEGTLISLSAQLEAARPGHRRRPPIWYG